MSDYGLLQEVRVIYRGTTLDSAALVGDTQLVVEYAGDFNDDPDDPDNSGGTLDLNGARLTYTGVIYGEAPEDPDTILLTAPLTAGADVDDSVCAVIGGQIGEDWVAYVTMGDGDPVVVPLSVDQRSQWPVGVYADPVPVVVSDDLLHLEDAPGRTASSRSSAWNLDTATAAADDEDVPVLLTFDPLPNSLQVKQNGVDLLPAEWVLSGRLVTVPPSAGVVIRAQDVFSAYYDYDEAGAVLSTGTAITPTWRDTAPQNLNGFLIPAEALIGDLLVAVAMVPDTETITANGWDTVGVSDYVTHTADGGTRTYRLEAYSFRNDGSTVPTVSNVAAQDVVCAMSAFENGVSVGGTFDTVADGTSASAPALDPVSLRVWGTIGNRISITPSRGTTVLSTNYIEIDIAMAVDSDPTAAPATATGAAGWCTASLVVTS